MGNTCTSVTFFNTSHVLAVRNVRNVNDLSFTDIDNAWVIAKKETDKSNSRRSDVPTVIKRMGWKTVRIFVSSTFRDFNSEREILVKKVFPDLREWCQSRRLHLVECDLRWGVPKDSTTETTLRTCLGEIDRCYAENLMPFFVNMTGERIGWIPIGQEIPGSLKYEYRWVDGMSVTEMEIMHGAYRIDNPNALFMIRDSSFLETIPGDQRNEFIDEFALAPYKLEKLKQMIVEKFESRVAYYKCEYTGSVTNSSFSRVGGLDENFAPIVLNFFKERIAAQYPLIDERKQDPLEETKSQHESFMKMASERVVGRDTFIDEMIEAHVANVKEFSPVVIFGSPGLGKTSIMAALADRCHQLSIMNKLPNPTTSDEWTVFHHFCGAVAGSTDLLNMLSRLLVEIQALSKTAKPPASIEEAIGLVRGALSNPRTINCIVIIDAINQFDDYQSRPAPISWLPTRMSSAVRIFFSLTPESDQFKNVEETGKNWKFEKLQPLDREIKERIVSSQLARYNKRLDRGQLELLLNKQSSDNPMWLSLATEELRVFGRFRELTSKIIALSDGLPELEGDILGRFERESDSSRLIATLCLLECSVHGLLESELLELLVDSALLPPIMAEKIGKPVKTYSLEYDDEHVEESLPVLAQQDRLTATQWADVFRVLRPFIRPFGSSGDGRLDFYHRSLSKAVRKRYFVIEHKGKTKKREDVISWFHKKLADYFAKSSNFERRIEEYPIHAWKCGDREQLIQFLSEWDVFESLYNEEFSRQLSQSWEHVYFMKEQEKGGEMKKDKTESLKDVFEPMEDAYVALLQKEIDEYPSYDSEKKILVFDRIRSVAVVLAQNGCHKGAYDLLEKAMRLRFPEIENFTEGIQGKTKMIDRDFSHIAESLDNDERIRYAKLLYAEVWVNDEERRQLDYINNRETPEFIEILEKFECVIAVLRKLAPEDGILGRALNRCSFFYAGVFHRGGCNILNREDCLSRAKERIEEGIQFYADKGKGQELNLADCYITYGVFTTNSAEQKRLYTKGLNLILDHAGQYHPLLGRTYLNLGISHEENGEYTTAYSYFRKWWSLLMDLLGPNNPRTQRAIRTLNEPMYRRIATQQGETIPQVGLQNAERGDQDDGSQLGNPEDGDWAIDGDTTGNSSEDEQ